MSNFLVSVVIFCSLVFAPVMHAAGIDCHDKVVGQNLAKADTTQDTFKSEKKNNEQHNATHDSCCSHTCDLVSVKSSHYAPMISQFVMNASDDRVASISYGPPLEPPSHA